MSKGHDGLIYSRSSDGSSCFGVFTREGEQEWRCHYCEVRSGYGDTGGITPAGIRTLMPERELVQLVTGWTQLSTGTIRWVSRKAALEALAEFLL